VTLGFSGFVRYLVLFVLLLGAIISDLRFRIVPNILILPALITGMGLACLDGFPGFVRTIWLTVLLAFPSYYGFRRGWMGGGDVKLVATTSLLLGENLAALCFLAGAISGGMFSLFAMVKHGAGRGNVDSDHPTYVPYAAAYALGVVLAKMLMIAIRFFG